MSENDVSHQNILTGYFGLCGIKEPEAMRREVKRAAGIDKEISELSATEIERFYDARAVVT